MHVTVISPAASLYDGDADSLVAPAFDGEVGVLPHHAPFLTLLGHGRLTIRVRNAERHLRVRGGVLQVADDTVRVVAEYAEEETA